MNQPKILAVDDRPMNLLALQVILEDLPCEFVPLNSGQELLNYFSDGDHFGEIALILLDAQMPILDGFETAERIRRLPGAQKIPLIFLTAIDDSRVHIQRAYKAGAADFIFKPIDSEILTTKVSVFLELYNSRVLLAQKERKSYESRLKLITDSVPASIAYVGSDLKYQFINAEHEKQFGRKASDVIGRSLSEVLGEKTFDEAKDAVERALKGETVFFEASFRNASGNLVEASVSYRPDLDENGQVQGFVSHWTDITESRRVQREMKDLLLRFQSLSESMPQIVYVANGAGEVHHYNSRWYQYTGLPPQTIGNRAWPELIHPDDFQLASSNWQRARQSGETWTAEFRLRRHDGQYRWHLGRSISIRDESGQIIRWIGTLTDIEDQKKAYDHERAAQEKIANSEQILNQVFNESPICKSVLVGPDLVFERANQQYLKLIGNRDIVGRKAREVLPELEAQGFIQIMNDVYQTRRPFVGNEMPLTIEHTSEGPKTSYIDLYVQPLFNTLGEIYGLLVQASVATEKVVAVQKIKGNNQRSDFLARASSVLNSSLDVETILRQLADITVPEMADWCSIQMRQPDGSIKQVAVSHKDPEKVSWAWEVQKQFPADPQSPRGSAHILRTGNSEMINGITRDLIERSAQNEVHRDLLLKVGFYSYLSVPIRTRETIVGVLSLISTEESKRVYSDEDLRLAQEIGIRAGVAVDNARLYLESQKINRIKDEFLATLSHELRTPLNVIQGHAELLKSEGPELSSEELEESIDAIYRNAHAQTALIGDLLDVSSIITGKISFKPQKLSPAKVLEAIFASLKPSAAAKGVAVSLETESAPTEVVADSTRLHQIIWNLASNALKFTDRGGWVKLSVASTDKAWSIIVSDSGQGIDPDFAPFIFDRFTQEDSSTTRRFGGLGLGLSIVKYLVELHGGQVRAESAGKQKGSQFVATFPFLNEPSLTSDNSKLESNVPPSPALDLERIKILLVEDSDDNRLLIRKILQKSGATVTEANSAEQARERLKAFHPDVIVSDIGLPDENGLEFIRKIRSSSSNAYSKVPAVALTAYVRQEERDAALAAGFQSHISKPINAKALISEILKLVAIPV